MSNIILELSLVRSSGVLAGIVASLAQTGLELKSQKLDRSNGGWLTIHATGEPPAPAALAERLAGTRGVERLMRMEIDGEAVLAEGQPIAGQIGANDLAELSSGLDANTVEGATESRDTGDELPGPPSDPTTAQARGSGAVGHADHAPAADHASHPGQTTHAKSQAAREHVVAVKAHVPESRQHRTPRTSDPVEQTGPEMRGKDNAAGRPGEAPEAPVDPALVVPRGRMERGEEQVKTALRRRRRRRR